MRWKSLPPFLSLILALAFLPWGTGCEKPVGPNVLLITIDTSRVDCFGCYGNSEVRTPHVDGLAAAGVQFMRNIATSQCTNPSHSSILTGLYCVQHTVYSNRMALPDQAETLAELLRTAGYTTLAAVSAKHLNPGNSNFGQGFDTFLECEGYEMTAGERNELFLERLRRETPAPFFAWVHYFDPHGNYTPPPPYDTLYQIGDDFSPIGHRKTMDIKAPTGQDQIDPDVAISLYKGEITYLDSEIGRLLDLLDQMGTANNTVVVLVADHGESMTEQGIFFCHAGMYNSVLHIPLIMRWPDGLPAGVRVEALTSNVDILPTLGGLLGLSTRDQGLPGVDLQPAFRDPDHRIHEAVFSESFKHLIRAVYQDDYKYIKIYSEDWSMQEDRLYEPFRDYQEERDLREVQPERAAQLTELLDAWVERAQQQALPSYGEQEVDAETEEALRALGYVD